MRSRVVALGLVAVALLTGCRDLVTPEGAVNEGFPNLELQVFGLGSDGALVGAIVTIDNSAYVGAASAKSASTITAHQGLASFEDMAPGLYDIDIKPHLWDHESPPWSETGVEMTDSPTSVVYEGVPCAIAFDWPILAGIMPEDTSTWATVHYDRRPDSSDFFEAEQRFAADENGLHNGVLPWNGNFSVQCRAYGPGFSLRYELPDLVALAANDSFAVASPLREHAMELRFGDEVISSGWVSVQQFDDTSDVAQRALGLVYPLDLAAAAGTVVLADASASYLIIDWAQGPAFLTQRVWLTKGPQPPPAIDLGRHRVTLHVTDPEDTPLDARVTIGFETRGGAWNADPAGNLESWLHPGLHQFTVSKSGFEGTTLFVDVTEDTHLEVQLEEPTP